MITITENNQSMKASNGVKVETLLSVFFFSTPGKLKKPNEIHRKKPTENKNSAIMNKIVNF